MKLNIELVFYTDGDFWFNNEDKLFNKDSVLLENADCAYSNLFDIDNEKVSLSLYVKGNARECKYAVEELLGNLICNIRTHDYYMVLKISDFLFNGIKALKGLNDDIDNFFYDNNMSGNYEGSSLKIYVSREDDKHDT